MSTKQIENSAVEIQIPKDVKVNLKGKYATCPRTIR